MLLGSTIWMGISQKYNINLLYMPRCKTRKNKKRRTRTKKGGTYPNLTKYSEPILFSDTRNTNILLTKLGSLCTIKFVDNSFNSEMTQLLNQDSTNNFNSL